MVITVEKTTGTFWSRACLRQQVADPPAGLLGAAGTTHDTELVARGVAPGRIMVELRAEVVLDLNHQSVEESTAPTGEGV